MALDGKTALVTGGAKGIGLAIAKRLLQDGARVAIADSDKTAKAEALELLADFGEVKAFTTDVSSRLDVHNLIASVLETWGDIDILVNNAGIVHGEDFLTITEKDFDRVMGVNLKGMFLTGQAVAQYMVRKVQDDGPAGVIVNMSSINGQVAIPNQVPYCVSKGGVNQLTRVMALSLAPHGIRVNAVAPGSIMTPMLAAVNNDPAARKRVLSRTPLLRTGEPSEVAALVAFLASDDSSYMTGEIVTCDGGRMALNYVMEVPEEES